MPLIVKLTKQDQPETKPRFVDYDSRKFVDHAQSVAKCSDCGCRVRGKNHNEGTHHVNRVKSKKKGW